ncbi:hypothetical protein H6G41_02425 [Tolypothrix sp. FACHB-123]|uniref:hypothetical protein n=1 Tax=Tolypothrix sp. FACHB-123 TaxID=2692868 RepID=UPI0016874370|nr:hypothetical protein [Tolypothrix sp. FACHB-123]MBD2353487.1 hypothetical protein [Tolypothrix sp. FACHB-123]
MVAKKPTDKSTKAEILQAYEELAKEAASVKTQLNQVLKENQSLSQSSSKDKPKIEPKTTMNQPSTVQQKMNYTIESLAKIQLGFGSAANELSEQLTTQASKLGEIRENVEKEVQELKQLHNLEITADILDNLIASYEDNSKNYQEEFSQQKEVLFQELDEQRKTWLKEQDENHRLVKERDENLKKTRQRDEAEYKYNLELQRKLTQDEYEQQQKGLNKQLEEFQQETEKAWAEKEKTIAEREKQFEESKAKVEAFPKEKETAIKKATEEGKGIAYYQAKVKSDLYNKEVEGQKRFYEQRLQSLEQTISNQDNRLENLSKQLESALKQVQDLAVKAIEGTANVNSYQAIKEIALEQAKSQVKNK